MSETPTILNPDEWIEVSQIKPHPKNANNHPDTQIKRIARGIRKLGRGRGIVLSIDNYILIGHGAVKAATQELGLDKVPFRRVEHKHDTPEAIALMESDNKLAEESEWDYKQLETNHEELKLEGFDLTLTGFTDEELNELESEKVREGKDDGFDGKEMDETPDETIVQPGDIWQLGDHRLLCGDSTDMANVKKLLDGEDINLIFTDPPYNVDYGASKNHPSWNIRSIANDSLEKDDWIIFNERLIEIFKLCKGDLYVWGASGPDGMRQRLLMADAGLHWSATIIWKKQQLVLSPAKYQRIYEPCFYGWVDKSSFRADRKQVEVWEFNRPHVSKLHPTMKPLDLCAYGIQNSSMVGDNVLDLFGGSGSTLMACEQVERVCYMIELEPHYCDVIIKRWEDYTGKVAVKVD